MAHDDNTPSLMVTEADNGALFIVFGLLARLDSLLCSSSASDQVTCSGMTAGSRKKNLS